MTYRLFYRKNNKEHLNRVWALHCEETNRIIYAKDVEASIPSITEKTDSRMFGGTVAKHVVKFRNAQMRLTPDHIALIEPMERKQ